MKLFRHGPVGNETAGVVDATGKWLDVSGFGEDFGEAFFESDGLSRLAAWCKGHLASCAEVGADVRRGPPIARPSKIVCIGLNYRAHAEETNAKIPTEPVIFLKATSAFSGPHDDLVLPRGSTKTDWEVELAVVIGKRASYVEPSDAMSYVAGFTLHNDFSEREYQLERGGVWDKGKGCDTFAPMGPCLVTGDEIDPSSVDLWLELNGETKQRSNSSDMIFDVPKLVSYVSHFMTLLPGDVLSTGTPAGVGRGHNPPLYLKEGDSVVYGIDGIGVARHKVVAAR